MRRALFWIECMFITAAWLFLAFVVLTMVVAPNPTLRAEPLGMWLCLVLAIGHLTTGLAALMTMRRIYTELNDRAALQFVGGTHPSV